MNRRIHTLALMVMAVLLSAVTALGQRPVNVKWTTEVQTVTATSGILKWTAEINPGWHIYGLSIPAEGDAVTPPPTEITVDEGCNIAFDGDIVASPAATVHYDEGMQMNIPTFEGKVVFTRKFHLTGKNLGAVITGKIRYMACLEDACTPPATEKFEITFGDPKAVAEPEPEAPVVDELVEELPETPAVESDLWAPVDMEAVADANEPEADSPWWVILGLGFLGGLVALLTPCVWPMIPMTVSFFLKKGKSRSRSIIDAITYALSIIIIYLVLGIAITMIFGASTLNELATSAIFNVFFFLLLVVFAVSFFGAFNIELPSKWSNAIDSKAESTTGFISIFFMAFTLVLVSFSCTGPIIGTLLVEAASQGNILGPALGMGGFALGLALPFGFFAFFPTLLKEMPRSGSWLNTVKVVLGFIELILALKFLSVADLAYGWHILDREVFLSLWIVLFALLGLYLLGKLRFSHDSPVEHVSIPRFFMALISLAFAMYLIPGLWGAPLKSISAFAPPLSTQDFNLYGGEIREFDDYEEGMAYAKKNNLPVLLDFTGYGCVNCRKMEAAVFDTEQVKSIVENDFVLIKLIVDERKELAEPYTVEEYGGTTEITNVGERWSYLQRHKFGTNSQPYYVTLDSEGKPLAGARVYNEDVDAFVKWLNASSAKFHEK